MKGLELAKNYYEEFGLPMLQRDFEQYIDRIAVGLVGHGSECFGYDDALSRDHDFEPGFCLWLTAEDEREFGFKLFRAYSKLPKEYQGLTVAKKSLFGRDAKGVHTIDEFYSYYIGSKELPKSNYDWLSIPDFYLAEAVNGEVFCDKLGEFTRRRQYLINECPEEVWQKKIASALFYMAQYGQYNYSRCLKHGEKSAAALALSEFARHTAQVCYLINKKYAPYYKWLFRGLMDIGCTEINAELDILLSCPHSEDNISLIEEICRSINEMLIAQCYTDKAIDYLEPVAYDINDRIKDSQLRNMPIML